MIHVTHPQALSSIHQYRYQR
ncbi:Protein of unknown function [Pyronema omphalodes CBS 100304]|uniref:Uncharacterized protein n=1 Tax=Pyronema omphalodes (strain CBS 100304) TaxID=1076935 RepID=U4KXD8_PYROM|nr:Protein of unknown function [Pyronema omphalodes CBS 100304]